jgi:diketogulonate reductase-like aldo/keto reductase
MLVLQFGGVTWLDNCTWQARGRGAVDAVLRALEVGYRHIDTATVYGNEE